MSRVTLVKCLTGVRKKKLFIYKIRFATYFVSFHILQNFSFEKEWIGNKNYFSLLLNTRTTVYPLKLAERTKAAILNTVS